MDMENTGFPTLAGKEKEGNGYSIESE